MENTFWKRVVSLFFPLPNPARGPGGNFSDNSFSRNKETTASTRTSTCYGSVLFFSGGASAVKEPVYFEVSKSSSQVRSPGVPDATKACLSL